MRDESLRNYARVLLKVGVNLQKGQCIRISADPIQRDFSLIMAEEAYRMGARLVRVDDQDPRLHKARIVNSEADFLDYVPGYVTTEYDTMLNEDWCLMRIDGLGDPDLMKDAPADRAGRAQKAVAMVSQKFRRATSDCRIAWTVAAMPTPGWAAKVLGKPASEAAREELWEIMTPILKLDQADPVAAWERHAATLNARTDVLNSNSLREVRFEGPGTDLRIGMIKGARWVGAGTKTQSGRPFFANLPTEEVFTVPDFRSTEGRVAVTRPVKVLERQVKGAWFRFEKGRVVDFGAEEGADRLEQYFAMDENNRFLGEVALVDSSSPIFRSGRIFESILFDENAACHVALGNGIGMALGPDLAGAKDEALRAAGFNIALQHTDFMIGSDEVSVTGTRTDGSSMPIIKAGRFAI